MRQLPPRPRLIAATLTTGLLVAAGSLFPNPASARPDAGPQRAEVAVAATISASSSHPEYPASNAGDGNQGTYWESANNAFPQWIQADLGAASDVNRLVLKLPPGWGTRTQTLAVQNSNNGSTFSTLVAATGYTFNPASGNTVTVNLPTTNTRYLRLHITANNGWPAGQLSEFEVHGPTGGTDTLAPTAPTSLAFTQPASGQIRLTWNAASDNVGVVGYDVYANGALRANVGNVLTYTDSQPATATVSYYVRARDAAGNVSGNSNTVTRTGTGNPPTGTNLAVGKPITASSTVHTFVAANANDGNVATYWEGAGGAYPSVLTVQLGANATVSSVVVRLNPDSAWGPRNQTIQVLGREQSSSSFTSLSAATSYSFSPGSGNSVTIPVSGNVADVRLSITANSGAPAGQVAEFQVFGVAAPNPDLTVTAATWSPAAPVETTAITVSATVQNAGTAASGATNVNFYLGTTLVGTAAVGGLAAGASSTVTANAGPRNAGTYQLTAKVDESNAVIEQSETNNSFTNPSSLTVAPVASSDLVAVPSWSPSTPANGQTVTFSVAIRNQGTIASASGAHGITVTVLNPSGTAVRTLTGSYSGAIAAGASTAPVSLGTWTAANGRYTVRTVLAADANELPVKQANNTSDTPFFVGRGANMPYEMYEAEDGTLGGGATAVGPNRIVGDLAGEASGRRAVTLNNNGAYVEWTTRAPTNTLVTRFSMPDAPGGGGANSTLNIYVDGVFHKAIDLTSRYAWLYGNEAQPNNSPGSGGPRHIYDEANVMLNSSIPAGSRIRLQKDPANSLTYAIDFINLEQVAPRANPDPARYATPTGTGHQDVQNALDRVRMDTTGNLIGVYLPPGTYSTSNKFQVYGKAVRVVGAGLWYTRFQTPPTGSNTDAGFRVESSANGSTFEHLAFFGNYVERIDGPGKVWGELSNVSNLTFDNVWVEHTVCMFWGVHVSNITIKNSRIRNTFADAINMTNGSTNNLVTNVEGRGNGDDAFALFSATDSGGGANTGNVFENLTATLTWRAAGVAVYGGQDNIFRNMYIADQLVYSGITISSLDFGYPFVGFGPGLTRIENASIVRAGGHFWGAQTFPAIWVFAASKEMRAIRVTDVDIVDPTYHGIMFQTNYVGGQPQNSVTDTIFTNISISGAQRSGDAYDAKSGFGIWANEMPEAGQGPARGSAVFNNLRLSNNYQNIRNTTSTFTITVNP
ncbi:discoidin domain-containing protein [Plantactinospora endophytica]|uniref:Glycosyl hydrolase n=1 Tax=Plantactinospora endophytica TaxID=673535 RepID=A0ABQ4EA91_9ACTN|nr:discoidin domain-containing protein [Plantactinospora endophytica]GIG91564.1 glycosyl hydrolase [Plantactinospora endophytica]